MGQIKEVTPVKLFIGIIFNNTFCIKKTKELLIQKFGEIDIETPNWSFNFTNYYEKEMGTVLFKKFLSFKKLINPIDIKDIKIYTNNLEKQFESDHIEITRPVNLDPGYLSLSKVVLATTKNYNHRIYIGNGIYAEVTLHYQNKSFQFWPWTYSDYKTSNYLNFFQKMRNYYKTAI